MEIFNRSRRLRQNKIIRNLVAETRLDPAKMIQPYFITESGTKRIEIKSMPGIFRDPADRFLETFRSDFDLGINKVMLFGVVEHKDARASTADDKDNPVILATRSLKDKYGESVFISVDVCLCEYTDSGHCGLIIDGRVDNDSSLERLGEMAMALANAGADCLGPSDMMDGRIGFIRRQLEVKRLCDTLILAYCAKYASNYYGPFRDAAESAPKFGDRRSYQMDIRNQREAVRELELDLDEGADIVIEEIPIEIECKSCNYEGLVGSDELDHYMPIVKCPQCEDVSISITKGRECNVKNIKIEKEDEDA